MFRPNMEFAQSWNFFHLLYIYSRDPTKDIYLESARRDLQNGVKILVLAFSKISKKFNFFFSNSKKFSKSRHLIDLVILLIWKI